MGKGNSSGKARGNKSRRAVTPRPSARAQGGKNSKSREQSSFDARTSPDARKPPEPFVLGIIPGATVSKWVDLWRRRMPEVQIELRMLSVAEQAAAFDSKKSGSPTPTDLGPVHAALIRLPFPGDEFHVIPLYEESPVVVFPVDSHLAAAEQLLLADLVGEVVIVARDDVLSVTVPGAKPARFAPPESTKDAIATVATGVGVTIVPMSLARLHQRKDVTFRPLSDGPTSQVGLAWHRERENACTEAFIGIVRGRTANSSR